MAKFIIYTDGASRGNPGEAASSFIIKDEHGQIVKQEGIYLGTATNNQAEYQAVKFALTHLKSHLLKEFPTEVEIRSDSTLIVNQLAGKYKIKNPQLRVFVEEVKRLEEQIGRVSYAYIPRAQNSQADYLANKILDAKIYG